MLVPYALLHLCELGVNLMDCFESENYLKRIELAIDERLFVSTNGKQILGKHLQWKMVR